jgi:plastocyanin
MMWGNGGNDGWWIVMWIWMALFWVGVIAGSMWLMRSFRNGPGGGDAAHEILDRRLASGEIDVDEHRKLSAELGGPGRGRSGERLGGWLIASVVILGLLAMATTMALASDWDGWDGWGQMGRMHGGGRDTSSSSAVQGGMSANVTIRDFAFEPGNLEVPVGATVTWINEDSAQHDATARNADWETERLSEDESDTLTFDSVGEYNYYCSIHPSMKATLVVGE